MVQCGLAAQAAQLLLDAAVLRQVQEAGDSAREDAANLQAVVLGATAWPGATGRSAVAEADGILAGGHLIKERFDTCSVVFRKF